MKFGKEMMARFSKEVARVVKMCTCIITRENSNYLPTYSLLIIFLTPTSFI